MMRVVSRLAAVAVLAGAVACSKDSTSPGGGVNSALGNYYGVYGASDGTVSVGGTVVIIISTGSATGTLTPVGGSGIALNGTYNAGSGAVSLTGGGNSLGGTIANGELDGTFTGPGGEAGKFGSHHGNTSSDVQLFCGTYAGATQGVWNLAKTGNALTGAYADDGGGSAQLTGTVSGTALSITFSGGTAAGTLLTASTMGGTWTAGANSGTWAGATPCP
jgi:fibronectin-binding autotransporter adhesin